MPNTKQNNPVQEVVVEKETSKDIIPQRNALVKQTADIDGFLDKRKEFIDKVSAICVEGKDYHIIQGKKSLAKGGAEKIASIFQWNATFEKDTDAIEMLGTIAGLVAFKCTLAKGNKFVGEGRGAATLAKNGGDANKTLKMAQKSAFIDAVLRASGLSDFFTQDLEDMPADQIGTPTTQNNAYPATEKQLNFIDSLMDQKGVTKEEMFDQGFDLDNLTGGKEGTASEAINYLYKFSSFSNGLKPLGEEDKLVSLFTKDLEECTTPQMYAKVSSEIKWAKENGKLTGAYYDMVLKTAKVIAQKIQDSLQNEVLETKPKSKAAELMEKGIQKAKAS